MPQKIADLRHRIVLLRKRGPYFGHPSCVHRYTQITTWDRPDSRNLCLPDICRPSNSSFWYADSSVAHPAGVHLLRNTRLASKAAINYTKTTRPSWYLKTGDQLLKQLATFDRLQRFVTMFTINSQRAALWAKRTQTAILSRNFFKTHL
jgi:hypothetical protein